MSEPISNETQFAERTITIPSSHINVITLKSDVDSIIITPTDGAKVTFTSQANTKPTVLKEMASVCILVQLVNYIFKLVRVTFT